MSVDACKQLKKRSDKEIEAAEKKSAVRRKVEEGQKMSEKK